MRDTAAVSFVQGRNAIMMLPGLMDLTSGVLPLMVETIYADDLKESIVDIGLTRKIVAVKTNLEGRRWPELMRWFMELKDPRKRSDVMVNFGGCLRWNLY